MVQAVVGVDVGGSGCRVAVRWDGGRAERSGQGVEVSVGGIDVEAVAARVGAVLDVLVAEGAPQPQVAALGMTGLLTLADRPDALHAALRRRLGAATTVVVSDTVTALVGGLGLHPGAVVAAGTGAVALGTDLAGRWDRVDGWGHLYGDDGGGAWIGAAGLRAAARAHDGRPGGSDRLLAAGIEQFGDPDEWPRALYPHPDRAGRLASFVPAVAVAAREGDAVAHGVWDAAGRELATSLVAAARGLDRNGARVRATWTGGLFAAGNLLARPFAAAVSELDPDLELVAPRGSGLDGAVLLAGDLVARGASPWAGAGRYLTVQTVCDPLASTNAGTTSNQTVLPWSPRRHPHW